MPPLLLCGCIAPSWSWRAAPGPRGPDWSGAGAPGSHLQTWPLGLFTRSNLALASLGRWRLYWVSGGMVKTVKSWAHACPLLFLAASGSPPHRPDAEPERLLFSCWWFFRSWPFRALSPDLPFYTEETRGLEKYCHPLLSGVCRLRGLFLTLGSSGLETRLCPWCGRGAASTESEALPARPCAQSVLLCPHRRGAAFTLLLNRGPERKTADRSG